MAQNQINLIVTTTSAVCGGLGKAVTAHLVLLNITIQGMIEVAVYACISAVVGFGVKKGIDAATKFINRKN